MGHSRKRIAYDIQLTSLGPQVESIHWVTAALPASVHREQSPPTVVMQSLRQAGGGTWLETPEPWEAARERNRERREVVVARKDVWNSISFCCAEMSVLGDLTDFGGDG